MDNFNMDPTPARTEQQIEEVVAEISRRRDKLGTSLKTLRYRVDTVTHWRRWIQSRPLLSLAAAAVLGILLGKGHRRIHRNSGRSS